MARACHSFAHLRRESYLLQPMAFKLVWHHIMRNRTMLPQAYFPVASVYPPLVCQPHGQLQRPYFGLKRYLCACSLILTPGFEFLMRLSLNSGTQKLLPCHSGHLPVRLLCRINLPPSHRSTPASSWEFFTTFDYEFSIIRGRRPYRKTIWVSFSCALPTYPTALD